MNRTGLVIAFAVAAAVGLVFGMRPDLDLKLAAPMIRPICARATRPSG
jgi:hypothetical protein